ncbi:ScbA/BarX family gamma-butyrolactone biosynthesis protein [Streptomyces purpureus]|nr:ScbA/BarX family gamma-butyrolactone biosynthesis protein [Streptomyces purpureus]
MHITTVAQNKTVTHARTATQAGTGAAARTPRPVPHAPTASFAHRDLDRDVLITGWTRRDEMAFSVDINWARDHCFFAPAPGSVHHHMLIAQTIRQVTLSLAHAAFEIPTSDKFLMNELTYAVDPHHPTTLTDPVRVEAEYSWEGRRCMRVKLALRQRGATFATSDNLFSWVPPRVYGRMRGDYLTALPGDSAEPVAAPLVGRIADNEVLLAPGGRPHRWQLRWGTGHMALIDHAVDHVPGLVLLEAAHQAAYAFAGAPHFNPTGQAMYASRYVEFDAPCWIEAHALPARAGIPAAVEVIGLQRDSMAFRCVVEGFTIRD